MEALCNLRFTLIAELVKNFTYILDRPYRND